MGTVLVRNVLSNVVGRGSSILAGLLITPFVLHTLGPERFGFWSLLNTIAGTAVLMDLGLGSAVTRFVAGSTGESQSGDRRGVLTTGALLAAGLALLWIMGGLLGRGALLAFARVLPGWRSEALAATGLSVVAAAVGLLALVPGAALTGVHRLDLVNRTAVAATLVQITASLALLAQGAGIVGLAWALLLANATTLLASLFLLRRVAPALVLDIAAVSSARLLEQLRFSAALQVIALGVLLQFQLPKFVLARGAGLAAAGEYELAYRVAFAAWSLPSMLLPPLLPAFAEWTARDRWDDAWALYERAARYLLAIAMPIAALLAASAPALFRVWIGPGHGAAALSLIALATLLGINVVTSAGCMYVRAIGRPWIEARYHVLSFALQLVLVVWFVPRFSLLFPLLAMLISGTVGTATFLWMFHRGLGRSLRAFVLRIAAVPALVSFAGGGVALAVGGACVAGTWSTPHVQALVGLLLGGFAGAVAIVAGLAWLGYVSREELTEVLRRVPAAVGLR
jgi:O-antigen/teichoic acid export membrane protein